MFQESTKVTEQWSNSRKEKEFTLKLYFRQGFAHIEGMQRGTQQLHESHMGWKPPSFQPNWLQEQLTLEP